MSTRRWQLRTNLKDEWSRFNLVSTRDLTFLFRPMRWFISPMKNFIILTFRLVRRHHNSFLHCLCGEILISMSGVIKSDIQITISLQNSRWAHLSTSTTEESSTEISSQRICFWTSKATSRWLTLDSQSTLTLDVRRGPSVALRSMWPQKLSWTRYSCCSPSIHPSIHG